MFKTRVKKWGLDKKNKAPEMEAILQEKQQRDALGKESAFYIRGKLVDFSEVHRYFRRKGLNPDVISKRQKGSRLSVPHSVRCVTPKILPAPSTGVDENRETRSSMSMCEPSTVGQPCVPDLDGPFTPLTQTSTAIHRLERWNSSSYACPVQTISQFDFGWTNPQSGSLIDAYFARQLQPLSSDNCPAI